MPPSDAVLEAVGVRKTFTTGRAGFSRSRVSAVDGVDLALHSGEVLGLVGESGCGKSTFARLLVGLETPDSGSVRVQGEDIGRLGRSQRRALRSRVQMVFQDPYTSLDPRLTVLELVAEPLVVHRRATNRAERRRRVASLLETVGLDPDTMGRHPHQFSGGQRQRIGIARALALRPDVLVCDEPVSALDVSVQAQVVNLLRDLQHRLNVALLFIAHDLSVVRHIADRTAVMYLGRIAETGPTEAIYRTPAHPYTQALLSASPVVDRRARGRLSSRIVLGGDPPSPTQPPPGCRFHTRCRLAVDRCAVDPPELRHPDAESDAGAGERAAACHRAEVALTRTGEIDVVAEERGSSTG